MPIKLTAIKCGHEWVLRLTIYVDVIICPCHTLNDAFTNTCLQKMALVIYIDEASNPYGIPGD